MRLLSLLLLGVFALLSSGCLFGHNKKPKSASHIYGNEAPNMKYQDKPDRAGGQLTTF